MNHMPKTPAKKPKPKIPNAPIDNPPVLLALAKRLILLTEGWGANTLTIKVEGKPGPSGPETWEVVVTKIEPKK